MILTKQIFLSGSDKKSEFKELQDKKARQKDLEKMKLSRDRYSVPFCACEDVFFLSFDCP